jgi:predicted aldo/keto reductase-like oxidoreductase
MYLLYLLKDGDTYGTIKKKIGRMDFLRMKKKDKIRLHIGLTLHDFGIPY